MEYNILFQYTWNLYFIIYSYKVNKTGNTFYNACLHNSKGEIQWRGKHIKL